MLVSSVVDNIFKKLAKGNASSKEIHAYFVIIAGFYWLMLLLANIFFPSSYTILDNSISTLGRQDHNPLPGWIFFSMGFWIMSLAILPYHLTVTRIAKKSNKVAAGFMLVFQVFASVGLFLIGTFQEGSEFNTLHNRAAYFGFGGFFLSAIFSWPTLGKQIRQSPEGLKQSLQRLFRIMIIITCIVAAGFVSQLVLDGLGFVEYGGLDSIEFWGKFLGFPFWEWALMITIWIHSTVQAYVVGKLTIREKR